MSTTAGKTGQPGYHEHWKPGQPHIRHVHAAGRTPHEHAVDLPDERYRDCGCGGADHDECALANSFTVDLGTFGGAS